MKVGDYHVKKLKLKANLCPDLNRENFRKIYINGLNADFKAYLSSKDLANDQSVTVNRLYTYLADYEQSVAYQNLKKRDDQIKQLTEQMKKQKTSGR